MIHLEPTVLEGRGIRLEPLTPEHAPHLEAAARDGELWRLFYTSVPGPGGAPDYIATALAGWDEGHRLPWAVRDVAADEIIGSTSYHDIMREVDRVEIGYTWYKASAQRTHVNTTCKLLLLEYAFDTVGCGVVGLRTDNFNFRSQKAIEGIGAKKDGVIRHHARRMDGSVRDSVMYSILRHEWAAVRKHLETRLLRHS